MEIKISSLSEGHHYYTFDEKASDIGLDNTYREEVHIKVDLEKNKDQFIMRTDIDFSKNLVCDRCLKDFDREFSTHYMAIYLTDISRYDEVDEDTTHYISKDVDIINITQDVFDYIQLSIPMKQLCSEECKGLCPKCGADRNVTECNCEIEVIDPRWNKLKDKFIK